MANRLLEKIDTYYLMTIVLFFSYIYDSIRSTFQTNAPLDESSSVRSTSRAIEDDEHKQTKLKPETPCPLAKMPTILRLYFYFSTLSHLLITFKYIILSMIKYRLIPDQEMVACYLPGRVTFFHDLVYESPGMAIMMSGSHLVWRSLWYVFNRRLELESLQFIVFDDKLVEATRDKLSRKFVRLNSIQRERMYEMNRMFCQRIQTVHGQSEYLLRKDRDLIRKQKLNNLVRILTVVMLMNTVFFGTPLAFIMMRNILSHDYFDINYPECRSFSSSKTAQLSDSNLTSPALGNQIWSFSDPYRVGVLLVDMFENFMIVFDSASGLTWPLLTSTIVALDLAISMDDISKRVEQIIQSLTDDNQDNGASSSSLQVRSITDRSAATATKLNTTQVMELEIITLQSDIMIAFDNVRKVDRYINAFAAYAIIFWVSINVTYEVLYVSRRPGHWINPTVALVQMAALILLTFAFAHLGRTHTKTVKMYHTCCSLMAHDPYTLTTKQSWLWLLEYYHPQKSLFSLHMGWTVLTFSNYIKFMLYSITFSLVLINLVRQELH